MPETALLVNGKEYAGWKSVSITHGIETIAAGFDLSVSERWNGQDKPWPIHEEDECVLRVGREILVTGWVDKRSVSFGPEEHSLKVSGRSKTAALVDCSALLSKWEFASTPLLKLAKDIAQPFGISVTQQEGLVLPAPSKVAIDPGDSAFDAIEKACRLAGVLPIADGGGRLVLTRAGTRRATTALVEGENMKVGGIESDATGRYHRYVVLGQHAGSDEEWGEIAAAVRAEATDSGVRRTDRVLVVRPESGVSSQRAKLRAQWEAAVRAARGDVVTATVQGWTQADGTLWPVNALVSVKSPLMGVDGDLLISQARLTLDDDSGTLTQLTLRRPDAFLPQPDLIAKGFGYWKEIRRGV